MHFKHDISTQGYLNSIIDKKKYRITLSRFRVSPHDLQIETGRHHNIDIRDKKCNNCNMNMIEDEYNFLLVCPKHRELRQK